MKKYASIVLAFLLGSAIIAQPNRGLTLNKFKTMLKLSDIGIGHNSITIAINRQSILSSDIIRTKQYDFTPLDYTIQVTWHHAKTKKVLHQKTRRKLYKRFSYAQIVALVNEEVDFLTSH